jgi:hypothetical protein
MDHRHKPPIISLDLHWDWANPLVYWFIGLFGVAAAAIILVLVQ